MLGGQPIQSSQLCKPYDVQHFIHGNEIILLAGNLLTSSLLNVIMQRMNLCSLLTQLLTINSALPRPSRLKEKLTIGPHKLRKQFGKLLLLTWSDYQQSSQP